MAGPTQWLPVAADPRPSPGTRKRPRRWHPLAAALLACALLPACTNTTTTPPPSTPQPSGPSSGATASPKPTPSASPSEKSDRERALADSKQTYIDFTRAMDQFAQAGGGVVVPGYLDPLMHPNSPVREYVLGEMSAVRREKLKSTGFGILRDVKLLESSDLGASPPELHWSACLDQSGVEVTKAGKPYPEKPDYLAERAILKLDRVRGRWRIWDLEVQFMPSGDSCRSGKQ